MTTLKDLLKKHKADFVSVIIDKIVKTHIKGMGFNGDIEVKGKYTYKKGDKILEGEVK